MKTMFPQNCANDHYLENMFNFAKKFNLESELRLFSTKRIKDRPKLEFYRFVLDKKFSIYAENFVNDYLPNRKNDLVQIFPFLKDYFNLFDINNQNEVLCKYHYYAACTKKSEMVACTSLFSYELGNESIIQLGDSVTSQVYFSVAERFQQKNIGTDLLFAVVSTCLEKKFKFYVVEPLDPMIIILDKFGFVEEKSGVYILDCGKENDKLETIKRNLNKNIISP